MKKLIASLLVLAAFVAVPSALSAKQAENPPISGAVKTVVAENPPISGSPMLVAENPPISGFAYTTLA